MRPITSLKLLLARGALALMLLFTQQQAALHWLGHAIDATHAKYGGPIPSDHCDECPSFSALGAGAISEHAIPVVPMPREALAPYTGVGSAQSALLLAFRSRAPPVLS